MSKPLLYYCGAIADEPIFKRLEDSTTVRRDDPETKLALALSILHMVVNHPPFSDKSYALHPGLVKDTRIALELTRDGKLQLVRALLDQVRSSEITP